MILDFTQKAQIGFQDPATPLAEGIVDLHNTIFFWLILIFTPVVIIFLRIIKRSLITWDSPTKMSILKYRRESFLFNRIIHGTLLEIIWTITPTIILIAIAIPSFGLIYAMDSINDPDWTVKVIGLLLVAVTAKSQLSSTFWLIIFSFLFLGIKNKGLKFFLMFWNKGVGIGMRILSGNILLHLFSKVINLLRKKNKFIPAIGPFLFLCAFEIIRATRKRFKPIKLGKIWVKKLYLFAQKVWAGFFLLTTLCCKKIVIQPRNVLQKSTILIFITEYEAELYMFIFGLVLVYVVIKIIDLLIKEKQNLKFWYTLVITALNWVIVILLISYIIVNLLFIIFPMQVNKTILTIGSILSLCTLWLVISNLFFIINKYKDRFSDQNRFFRASFYMCQIIIKVLYKTKLIDKMFHLVCFQFFNINQKTADLCNVISIILCLIYLSILRTVIQALRMAISHEVYDFYSPNQLFVIWILFLAGFTGFLFRLCVNFSFKVVTFTFLYFPIYYNVIIDRTNTVNKPKINFYYQRIPVQNWFFVSLLGIRLGVVLFHSVMLYLLYKVYLGKLELKQTKQQDQEYVESLNCNKILTDLEKVLHNFTGSEEELKEFQKLKAFCEAKLHPEDAEILLKESPKRLELFRSVYPKNTTMKEQPLIKDTENLDILAWAQANVFFIVIGIIILLVVVYFVKKNKPK